MALVRNALARAPAGRPRRRRDAATARRWRVRPGHPMATAFPRRRALPARPRRRSAAAAATPPSRPCRSEAEFHNNLGLALAAADRTDEAIAAYRRALRSASGACGRVEQSRSRAAGGQPAATKRSPRFATRSRSHPEFAQAHWNLALALLAHQEFAEGWREYDWRSRVPEFAARARTWPGPRWDGADPAGRTLLVTSEQGLGDTLQFIRLAQPLAARGARVLVERRSAARAAARERTGRRRRLRPGRHAARRTTRTFR